MQRTIDFVNDRGQEFELTPEGEYITNILNYAEDTVKQIETLDFETDTGKKFKVQYRANTPNWVIVQLVESAHAKRFDATMSIDLKDLVGKQLIVNVKHVKTKDRDVIDDKGDMVKKEGIIVAQYNYSMLNGKTPPIPVNTPVLGSTFVPPVAQPMTQPMTPAMVTPVEAMEVTAQNVAQPVQPFNPFTPVAPTGATQVFGVSPQTPVIS